MSYPPRINLPKAKGHFLVDIYGCQSEVGTAEYWLSRAPELCELLHLNIRDSIVQRFSPHGVTLLYILAESHLAIHTWPEENFATLEIFTCLPVSTHKANIENFIQTIPCYKTEVTIIVRGAKYSSPHAGDIQLDNPLCTPEV
jgi:S-adenosylmethionine decarboxylase